MNVRAGLFRAPATVVAAAVTPAFLTAVLVSLNPGSPQAYVYLYLGVVAALGVALGLRPAIVAAVSSFLLVDYFFIPPFHTLQFANPDDLVDLSVFAVAATFVGLLGSRRRRAQMQAEALSSELQTANIDLARLAETERQVHRLQESDRIRREVLANVSHDLRTPLASILTGSTALLQRDSLPQDLRGDLTALADSSRRLSRLISDILDITRIESNMIALHPSDTDLADAFDAAKSRLLARNPSRVIESYCDADLPDVMADWDRLGQILDNLLENADHASPDGGVICLRAGVHEDSITVNVIDSGPGVHPALRSQLFERFARGQDIGVSNKNGMGLGLAIVRGLVEAQGGRVWLEESPDEGANFAFTLPTASGPQKDAVA